MAAEAPWRNRIVGSAQVPPTELLANPNNWRTHPGPQRDALRGSLGIVGWVQQVPPDRRAGLTDPDDVPPLRAPDVHRGELWQLGDHRLLVGDATDPADVGRLLEDAVDVVWTDPPYGVDVTGGTADRLKIENDNLPFAETQRLVAAALGLARLRPGGPFYVAAPAGGTLLAFLLALREVGWPLRQTIVWVKDRFVLGRSDYHFRHEELLSGEAAASPERDAEQVAYGWAPGAAHEFYGGRRQDTAWEIARPAASREHPTMKPVELVARSLEASSRPGERVYDPFVGSGTTLIACEQLGRRGFGMELDPRYAQATIDRWEAFTGRTAERVDG